MNKNLLLAIGAIVLLAAGYMLFLNKPQTEPALETIEEAVTPSDDQIMITLVEQNNSGQSGTAILEEEDGKVKVTLAITGGPKDVAQPAHIHMGACPDVGEVTYPLTNVMNGMSETMLDVTLDQLRSELPLAINVHKSVTESGVYTSCGDITF